VEELRKSLEDEKQRLSSELQKSEQSRNAMQQQFEGSKISEASQAQQLQRTIDELRRQQQQQQQAQQQRTIDEMRRQQTQPAPRAAPAPQPNVPTVLAHAYGISVHHRNSASSLTVIDKTGYANDSWTQISDGDKFVMPWSGNSGLLRFRSSNGEEVGVAVGVHNYVRWCHIVTDFNFWESCYSRLAKYYNGSDDRHHSKLWQQEASCSVRSSRGKTVSISYYVAHGHELHATLMYY
jgi:hypothetical protein